MLSKSEVNLRMSVLTGSHCKNPAEIILWLTRKFLKQVHSFERLASLMRHNLASIHGQILNASLRSSILPKTQKRELKICIVHVHVLFAPKLNLHLPRPSHPATFTHSYQRICAAKIYSIAFAPQHSRRLIHAVLYSSIHATPMQQHWRSRT